MDTPNNLINLLIQVLNDFLAVWVTYLGDFFRQILTAFLL